MVAGRAGREHADAAAGRARRGPARRGRTVERPGRRRDRRPAERRRADRAHHERGGADVEAIWESSREQDDGSRPSRTGSRWTRPRPQLLGARGVETGSYFWPTAVAVSANPSAARRGARAGRCCRARGTLWSWTTNHYAPPEPYVVARPVRAVHRVRGRARRRADGRARRSSRPAPTPTQLEVGMDDGARARPALRRRRARVRRVAVGARGAREQAR